jgi:hypothetical protein
MDTDFIYKLKEGVGFIFTLEKGEERIRFTFLDPTFLIAYQMDGGVEMSETQVRKLHTILIQQGFVESQTITI